MKLVVVIFPPQLVQDAANSYRKRYDPVYALIPPHIKLTDIFEAAEEELPPILEHLRQVAQQNKSFTVKLHKVSHFHPTNNVLYLAIQDEEPLITLHRQIYHPAIIQQKPAYKYVPHLTIGQKLTDDELHDVYGQLRMKKFQFEFPVTHFHLLQQKENKVWTTYETFSLE